MLVPIGSNIRTIPCGDHSCQQRYSWSAGSLALSFVAGHEVRALDGQTVLVGLTVASVFAVIAGGVVASFGRAEP